jgi:hypothetical protein
MAAGGGNTASSMSAPDCLACATAEVNCAVSGARPVLYVTVQPCSAAHFGHSWLPMTVSLRPFE